MRADAVPASLAARGITSLTDNLPPGAGLDIARDFARVFRPEIEARLFGWKTSTPPRRVASADLQARP
jgi:hypothetical protein